MKLFLDDKRKPPTGWTLIKWPEEAIEYLKSGKVEIISLDHDLGDDDHGTGYDVILWIEKEVVLHNFKPPKIIVHSSNASARIKMEAGIKNIYEIFNYGSRDDR